MIDTGYDVTRLAFVLADLPVESGRAAALGPGHAAARPARRRSGRTGRPPRHGPVLALDRPGHLAGPASRPRRTDTTRYGTARRAAWDRMHPRLTHRGPGSTTRRRPADHRGHPDPAAGRSPARRPRPRNRCGCGPPRPDATAEQMSTGCWQAFLRRFDLEHTFRLFKQTLGWTTPRRSGPRRRRPLDLADHRRPHPTTPRPRPGRRPAPPLGTTRPPGRLTPARVRRGFRNIRPKIGAARPRTETQPTRPRPPTRLPQPAPRHPPRRRQARQDEPSAKDQGLNRKLSECLINGWAGPGAGS